MSRSFHIKREHFAFYLLPITHLNLTHQNLVSAAADLPWIDNAGVGHCRIIIRAHTSKQVAIWIEMQNTSLRESACRRDAVFYSRDRPPRTPDIVHDQGRASAHFIFC